MLYTVRCVKSNSDRQPHGRRKEKIMYYISLDLEWNQAYAEQLQAVQKRLNARLRGEVIQIGAVKLNEQMRICGSYSVIVKPHFFKKIHRHVRDLTGITQDMINGGVPLTEAAENFRRWCGEEFAFLTWGPDDIPMLKDNLRVLGAPIDWLDRTYDLQPIFNQQTDGVSRQRSLEYAMEYYQIAQTLPAHDALNDAFFTAQVAMKLDLAQGVANYTARRGQFLEEVEIGNADTGETGYTDIKELLAHPALTAPTCPLCGEKCTVKDKILHSKGQKYTCLISCETHGEMMISARLQHNFNGTWRLRKSVTEANEEAVATYRKKLAEQEEQKKTPTRRRRRPARKKTAVTGGENHE